MSNDHAPQQPVQPTPVHPHPGQQAGHPYPPQQQGKPYAGQPYPGQPVPVRRPSFFARHKVLTVFLAILALIVVVSIASNLGGDAPSSTTDAAGSADAPAAPEGDTGAEAVDPAPAPEPEPVPAAAGIGTAVRDGKFEFTVTSVEPGVARVGDDILGVDAQGQFVLVHVTVTNIGDRAQMFDASSQKMFDAQGREHSADSTAGIYLGDANSFLNDINPGNSIQGVVIFDVPADAVPTSIELHDSFLSGGTTVALG
jgi:hypothetical protein